MEYEIKIHNIECHAFHGCMEEEGLIGGEFTVDLDLMLDFSKAVETDQLHYTADYVLLHSIVREEMKIPSKLIEHVAGRILKRIKQQYPQVAHVKVAVTKFNPPVNGQLGKATVVISD